VRVAYAAFLKAWAFFLHRLLLLLLLSLLLPELGVAAELEA
jgi:hypothetical protein